MKTRQAIAGLNTYIPGERRQDAIKLSSNENPLGCSPAAARAVEAAVRELNFYPDGAARDLVAAIAAQHGVSPDQIITGNGSDEVLLYLTATYLEAGERVLIAEHTFSEYEFASRLYGGEIVPVPMPDLEIRPMDYLAHIDERTRIVFLCSPNNPTGSTFTHDELVRFLDAVPADVLVAVDHAYLEYQDDPDAANADRLVGRYPNLVVLHTFSKIHGIAAVRLGYALATAARIAEMKKVRPPFSVNSVAQVAGLAALSDPDFVQRSREVNAAGLSGLRTLCDQLGYRYLPSQANFLAVDVGMDARAAAEFIAERGVTVRALTGFRLPTWLRITIGTPEQMETLGAALSALAADSA